MNFGKRRGIFNYRPLVSAFLFIMLGIIFVVGIFVSSKVYLTLSLLSLICLIVTIVLKSVLSKEKMITKLIIIILSFFIGFCFSLVSVCKLNKQDTIKGDYYIEGTVSCLASSAKSGLWVLNLKDVTITDGDTQKKVTGQVRVYISEGDGRVKNFVLGEKVCGEISLKSSEYVNDGELNSYLINKNISLIGFCSEDNITSLNKRDVNIFDSIKNKIKVTLDKFLSKDYSELAYTMLFGDKTNLNETIYESYSASGISHLLAVSGLHVGFLVTMISLILSLFKAKDKTKFIVITVVTFLYAFLCGFSVSVTRAFIMTVILLFAKLRMKKYDSLSSLSLAGIIILVFNPFYLFDYGFILSFSAVLGIILFSGMFSSFFNKIFENRLSSALSVSLAASITTILPTMLFFEKISIFSIITNVIVIPIASMAFMIMLPFAIIAMVIEPFGVFIYSFEVLMKIVTGISTLLGSVSLAGLNKLFIFGFGFMLICAAIICSDYIFINNKKRATIVTSLILLSICLFTLSFIC